MDLRVRGQDADARTGFGTGIPLGRCMRERRSDETLPRIPARRAPLAPPSASREERVCYSATDLVRATYRFATICFSEPSRSDRIQRRASRAGPVRLLRSSLTAAAHGAPCNTRAKYSKAQATVQPLMGTCVRPHSTGLSCGYGVTVASSDGVATPESSPSTRPSSSIRRPYSAQSPAFWASSACS